MLNFLRQEMFQMSNIIETVNFEHRNLIYFKSWVSGIEEQIIQTKPDLDELKSFDILSTQILTGVRILTYGIENEDEILEIIYNDLREHFTNESIKSAFDYQKLLNEVKIDAEDRNEQIKRHLIDLARKLHDKGCSKDEIYKRVKEESTEASIQTGYPFTDDKRIIELLNLGGGL